MKHHRIIDETLTDDPIELDQYFVLSCDYLCPATYVECLSLAERHRMNQFRYDMDRQLFASAHWLKRNLLAFLLDDAPDNLIFEQDDHGRPYVKSKSDIDFNISHSGSHVACAVSFQTKVGVDIETQIDTHNYELIKNYLNCSGKSIADTLKYWTLKEAFSKAVGLGLMLPYDTMNVTQTGNCYFYQHGMEPYQGWYIQLCDDVHFAIAKNISNTIFCSENTKQPKINVLSKYISSDLI